VAGSGKSWPFSSVSNQLLREPSSFWKGCSLSLVKTSYDGTRHEQQTADPELRTGGRSQVRTTHQRRE